MVKSNSINNKKRNATTNINSKPTKALKKSEKIEQIVKSGEGLFDNLDEEMDQEELEKMVNQINNVDSSEEEEQIEKEEEEEENLNNFEDDQEEEEEQNEFDFEDFEQSEEQSETEVVEEDKEEEQVDQNENMEVEPTLEEQTTAKKFRDLYMTKVTQAFGSDLDTIRQEPSFNAAHLGILIDSLEAGIDIFSNIEQEIILADTAVSH